MTRRRYDMVRQLAEVEARHAELYTKRDIDRAIFNLIYRDQAEQLLQLSDKELEEYYKAVFGTGD